ncbi:MAG: hypothetical protein ABIQ15_01750 [Nocardioides sp.]
MRRLVPLVLVGLLSAGTGCDVVESPPATVGVAAPQQVLDDALDRMAGADALAYRLAIERDDVTVYRVDGTLALDQHAAEGVVSGTDPDGFTDATPGRFVDDTLYLFIPAAVENPTRDCWVELGARSARVGLSLEGFGFNSLDVLRTVRVTAEEATGALVGRIALDQAVLLTAFVLGEEAAARVDSVTGDVAVRVTVTGGVVDHWDIDGDDFGEALAGSLPGSVVRTVPPFDSFSLRYEESKPVTVESVPRGDVFDPALPGCPSRGIGA